MNSIIKNIKTTDIENISKEDINTALNNINNDKKEIKQLSKNIRKIIIWIIELSKKYNINLNDKDIKEKILENLEKSTELSYYWLWKLLKNKLYNEKEKINNLEKLALYDSETSLPNKIKFRDDIENIKWNKIIIIFKIEWIDYINNNYWYNEWSDLINQVIEKVKNNFIANDYKLYRESWVIFWLCKEIKINDIFSRIVEQATYVFNKINEEINWYWLFSLKIKLWIDVWFNAKISNALIALSSENENNKIYSKQLEKELEKSEIEKEFWKIEVMDAILTWRIKLFFQWIYNNNTNKISKYEVLLRIKVWDKIICPIEFLNYIKWSYITKNLSIKIIQLLFEKMQNNNYNFSINLSTSDLENSDIINNIQSLIKKYKIKCSRLTIEVLEEESLDHINLLKSIQKIKKLWIKIAIDDFWIWYSWFHRIWKIKPDFIKIDWSLIKSINTDKDNLEIVKWIVDFSHSIWSKVVAEFVENNEIQKIIKSLNIEYSQWYFFSKPSEEILII